MFALPMKKQHGQSDVCANVEDAIAVAQFDSVLQVASSAEYLAVDKARFIGNQGEDT